MIKGIKFSLKRPTDPAPYWGAEAVVKLPEMPKEETSILSYSFSRQRWQRRWGLFWGQVREMSGGMCTLRLSTRGEMAVGFHSAQTPWSQPLQVGKPYSISGGWDGANLRGLVLSLEDGSSEQVSYPLERVPPIAHYSAPFPGVIEQVALYDHVVQRGAQSD